MEMENEDKLQTTHGRAEKESRPPLPVNYLYGENEIIDNTFNNKTSLFITRRFRRKRRRLQDGDP